MLNPITSLSSSNFLSRSKRKPESFQWPMSHYKLWPHCLSDFIPLKSPLAPCSPAAHSICLFLEHAMLQCLFSDHWSPTSPSNIHLFLPSWRPFSKLSCHWGVPLHPTSYPLWLPSPCPVVLCTTFQLVTQHLFHARHSCLSLLAQTSHGQGSLPVALRLEQYFARNVL